MAEDMIERAAKAISVDGVWPFHLEPSMRWSPGEIKRLKSVARDTATSALLAALDPEDEALLSALVDAPTFGKLDVIDARIIIELIRTHAQGGTDAA